jgi:glycosyltransferase involved in cell wall biosynthesis
VSGLDPRVRYFWQENAGVSAARNRGLAEARGAFIAFLDSDDVYRPWKLEAQVNVLRSLPEAGMVWSDMAAADPQGRMMHEAYVSRMYSASRYLDRAALLTRGRTLGSVWPACPAELAERRCAQLDIGALLFMGNMIPTPSVLIRRERQLAAGPFDLSLRRTGEDYDFHYRVCRAGPVVYLDVSSFVYRVGADDQLTAARHEAWMARNTLATISKVLADGTTRIGLPRAMVRRRLATVHRWVGNVELFENRRAARRHLLKSLWWHPWSAGAAMLLVAALLPPRLFRALLTMKRRARHRHAA